MTEMTYDNISVRRMLATGLSKITFFKMDGTSREMLCTLDFSIIPEDMQPSMRPDDRPASVRAVNPDVINVYDVENDGWRSFRFENLINIERE